MKESIRKSIAILMLIGVTTVFTGLALAAPSTSFQLIAFGVKPNTSGTFSGNGGDIGWARGNSDKGWHEGAWIPIKIVVTDVQTSYPSLSGFPTIKLGYDFTNGGNRFIDLVRDIQIGVTDLTDSQGWPQTNGTTTPLTNAAALPQTNLTQVEVAQDSVGEGQWPGYVLAETLSSWDPLTQVNTDYSGTSGTPTDGSHQITITAAQIQEWATNTNSKGANTIIIYAQMHLARTFIWSNGLESGYYSGSPGSAITYPEGGWVYGTSPYTGPTPDKRNGSGFVSGSSGHMYFNMTGIGADTTQLPVPPQPPGVVSGYKWEDDNDNSINDGSEIFLAEWGIHISGTLEGGIEFTAEIFTDSSGAYVFPNLTAGVWTVREHNHIGIPTTPVWIETYPSLENPGGTIGQGVAGPVTNINPFDFAPYGWVVTLTDVAITQGGLNFGNFQGIPDTMVTIEASIEGQSVDTVYAGDTVTLTITEKNTGQVELTGAYVAVSGGVGNLNDTSAGWSSDLNGDDILDPGETWSWDVDVTVNIDTAFVALGHGFDPQNNDISYVNGYENERNEFDVYAISPEISIEKLVDCDGNGIYHTEETVDGPTDDADWYVKVTNTGDSPVYNIVVTDDNFHNFGGAFNLLNNGDYAEFYYTTTISQTTTNTAYAEGTDELGGTVGPVQASATNNIINPAISIEKLVDCDDDGVYHDQEIVYGPTDDAQWYVKVTNTGDTPLYNIVVTDDMETDFGLPFDLLNNGDYMEFFYDTLIDETTTNTAYAEGEDELGFAVGPVQDSATNKIINPEISIVKLVDCDGDTVYHDQEMVYGPTDDAKWYVKVTNTGDSPVYDIVVTDDNGHNFGAAFNLLNNGDYAEFYYTTTIDETTTNTAYAEGVDEIDGEVGPVQSSATNYLINPDTMVGILSSDDIVYEGDVVTLQIVELNSGDVDLTDPYVVVDDGMGGSVTLDATTAIESGINDDILEVGESWIWYINVIINDDTTFTANGYGTDPLGNDVSFDNGYIDEQADVFVDVIHPSTTMQLFTYVYDAITGNVTLTITDKNDGDVPLYNAHIHLLANGVAIPGSPFGYNQGDSWSASGGIGNNADNIMDPGESWTWVITVTIYETTFFETWGHGTDPLGGAVDYDPENGLFLDEYMSVTVKVGGLTRTQGFWATHLDFTNKVFNDYLSDDINLGWKHITNINDLMGIFWANNAKNSNGSKRSALCQAKETASNQALAAILNSSIPGGKPLPAGYSLTQIATILAGNNINAIKKLNSDLDSFNNSGEDVAFDPSLLPIGRATPTQAKNAANIPFADCP